LTSFKFFKLVEIMLVEKDIQQILSQLADGDSIKVPYDGSDITIRVIDESSKLSLSALVYDGGNYIPNSVRRCLSRKSPFFHPSLLTFLTVDEKKYQVKLNYLGQAQPLNQRHFKELLEDFGLIAEKWRLYLDDHDKNDLVYVRVK
jgi:hypothetical protein